MGIFNSIATMANGVLERRAKRSEQRFNLEMAELSAKAQVAAKAAENEANWEGAMASKNTWMDDYWTLVLSIPLFMVFFPALQGYVKSGFDVLAQSVPEWYVWALLASISAAFARKKLPNVAGWLGKR
ncbi:MAG: hypothetical protein GQ535_11080 [Rhodobacteraceae bacterium]|nr:hypothetical protein [Paracoccaceae bacterium]